jgi:hypothetical protein
MARAVCRTLARALLRDTVPILESMEADDLSVFVSRGGGVGIF